jgi:class 3 adenylate cyclase/tetratricopeptide (TPR) repeat protein
MSRGANGLGLRPYVPRFAAEWDLDTPGALTRQIDATFCFVDISGFTALSERLARRGRIGAEELTEVLNHVFSRMLGVAYGKGGALLKFGGDALLLAFTSDDHAIQAAQAAVSMRVALREARTLPTSVGRVNLRMSVGIHSGTFDLFRVGSSHRELLVSGPAATATTKMEQIANAGEIVISQATAACLPAGAVGEGRGDGRLLRWRNVVDGGPGPVPARDVAEDATELAIPTALRAHLADRGGESEHRLASIGFVKFQGVDDLLLSEGPYATAGALDRVVSAVQQAADAESVTFLASDIDANGGKMILVTGVPAAQEDDEGRLLRAARAIVEQSLPLPVRIGVNRGHVFAGDIGTDFRRTFTVMGDTVNLAARLMAAASAGEVYATAGVLDHGRTGFKTDALEPFMVKGKSEPVQAYRLGAPTGPKASAFGTLPFRGREQEFVSVLESFKTAQDGQGQVVLLEAERGAGKTRLVTELIAAAAPATVLLLQGESYGREVPYLPLHAPLRAIVGLEDEDRQEAGRRLAAWVQEKDSELLPFLPFLAPMVDAEVEPTPESQAVAEKFIRDRGADTLIRALDAACLTPLLIVTEDAHWFDDTTSEICARLAEAARQRPWLVLCTRRPEEGGFNPLRPDLRQNLAALEEDAARELVEEATDSAPLRPHERDGIVARAGGSPLFLEELIRIVRNADIGALPDSLDAVAMREIDSLPAAPRRVLLLASVLGRSFDPELLVQLLDAEGVETDADPLERLHAQMLPDGGNRVRFRHAVLQEAAYQSLPFRARLGLHREVGEAIERGASELVEVAALLSLHFMSAQDWERAWRYARMAAAGARAAHAPGEAAAHLERAVSAARHLRGGVDDVEVVTVLAELAEMFELLGEYDRADDSYRKAATLSKVDAMSQARIADRRAHIHSEYLGKPSVAIRQLKSGAVRLAPLTGGQGEAEAVLAQLFAREADVRARQGRLPEALACSTRAIREAEMSGNTSALALALAVHDQCLVETGRAAEATYLGRALELYESLGDNVHAAITLNNLAGVEYYKSHWDRSAEYFARSIEASNVAGDRPSAAFAQINLGEIRVNQGRLEEAKALIGPARRIMESFGYRVMVASATVELARVSAFMGELDGAVGMLQSAQETFDKIGSFFHAVEVRARLAEVLVFGGRCAEARQALGLARDVQRTGPETPLSALVDRVELTLEVACGQREAALHRLGYCLEHTRKLGAAYDELVILALAARLGVGSDYDDPTTLREDLGVVRLPMLTWE